MYVDSYIIYICTFFSSLVLSFLYTKQKNIILKIGNHAFNIKDTYLIIMIIILSVVCGGRGFNVGIDTESYVIWQFDYIRKFGFDSGTMPFLIRLFVYCIEQVFEDYHFVYLFIALVTNTLFVLRFRDFTNRASLTVLIIGFLCFIYPAMFNTWRQVFAVAVVFFATRYVQRMEYLKYFMINILAILIHSSSIIGLIIIPLDFAIHQNIDKTRRYITKISFILFPVLFLLSSYLIYYLFDWQRYVYHLDHYGTVTSIGLMIPIKLLMLVLIGLFCLKKSKEEFEILQRKVYYISLIAVFLGGLDYFIVYAGRLSFYFILFESVLYSYNRMYWRSFKILNCLRIIYCLLGLYTFAMQLLLNNNHLIPYSFWN